MTLINQGLLITAIGMGLVFLMILALWGIMVLLVKLTSSDKEEKPEAEAEPRPVLESELTENEADPNAPLAAAIAVAWALENQAAAYAFTPSETKPNVNAWLSSGRTQQVFTNTIRGRKR